MAKRILLVSHSPLMSGGSERSLLEKTKFLKSRGYQVRIVLSAVGEYSETLDKLGIDYVITRFIPSAKTENRHIDPKDLEVFNADAIIDAYRIIREFKADLVIINTIIIPWFAYAAKALSVPVALNVNEEYDRKKGIYLFPTLDSYMESLSYHCDYFFYNSKFTQDKYKDKFIDKPGSIVYPVVKIKPEELHTTKQLVEFDAPELRIIVPGSIVEHKNQLEIIKALDLLNKRGVKFKISFAGGVGSEKYYDEIKSFIKSHDLGPSIGRIEFEKNLLIAFTENDVVVVPSKAEPFGRVTVEGLAAGRLVIGNDTGGTLELIKHKETGLLYRLGDEKDLADQLEWVFKNKKESREIAEKGQLFALKNFIENNKLGHMVDVIEKEPALRKKEAGDERYNPLHALIERNNYVNAKIKDYAEALDEKNREVEKLVKNRSRLHYKVARKVHKTLKKGRDSIRKIVKS